MATALSGTTLVDGDGGHEHTKAKQAQQQTET
jgi:hypothetical protein